MDVAQVLLWWLSALLAGAINSVAGGGSFFTFPALIFTQIPSLQANATSNAALWPAAMSSAWGYRAELHGDRPRFLALAITSLLGSTAGAILLITTPGNIFAQFVPWLMLVASIVFTFGGRIQTMLAGGDGVKPMPLPLLCVLQFPVAIYGGYFGGGQGLMMIALLSVAHVGSIHRMNAFKNALAAIHNAVGVVVFALAGTIVWLPALIMVLGAVPGGLLGVRLARRVDPAKVRIFVVGVAWVMTGIFAARTWL